MFSRKIENNQDNRWRWQLDKFANSNRKALAALAWGLKQEWQDDSLTLGIDLKPQPHFVCCDRPSIETLNQATQGHIQEIIGILDNYNPAEEVAIITIGAGQIKLIYFQPDTTPPDCFAAINGDLDGLIEKLESKLALCF